MFFTGNGSFNVPFRVSKTFKTLSVLQLNQHDLMMMMVTMMEN